MENKYFMGDLVKVKSLYYGDYIGLFLCYSESHFNKTLVRVMRRDDNRIFTILEEEITLVSRATYKGE